jgi:hypothetical protein
MAKINNIGPNLFKTVIEGLHHFEKRLKNNF